MTYLEKLPSDWQKKWTESGFSNPSLIQEQTFDLLKEKKNVCGISPTGSGKTLAYLLPLLQNVQTGEGNQLLILLSSQELAMQVFDVAKSWANALNLNVTAIIGGANTKRQEEKLKKRPEVIIGTAGRILELVRSKKIKLMNIETIVLDEVDQLLGAADFSLAKSIISHVPKTFQLAFFSATGKTVREKIEELAGVDLFWVDVSNEDTSSGVVTHFYTKIPQRERVEALRKLANMENFQGIVFFNQLSELGNAEEKLLYLGLPVASLASDQNKLVRKEALEQFKKGKLKLLLTTDVLSRGLDLEALPYVVNFDVPLTTESYTHRSGRTGRMGANGTVLTFLTENECKDFKKRTPQLTPTEVFLWGGKLVHEIPEVKREKSVKKKKK